MTIRQFKELRGCTNRALLAELKSVQPELDEPLISKMMAGVIRPSVAVQKYMDACVCKVENRPTDAFLSEGGISKYLTELEALIYDRLERATKWDPATRRELVFLTKKDDRTVRDMIKAIRKKGGRVCSLSTRYGYWVAKSDEEYKDFRKEYTSRICDLAETLRAMDGSVGGQLTWEELRG